jgi:hypothetical protein
LVKKLTVSHIYTCEEIMEEAAKRSVQWDASPGVPARSEKDSLPA